MLLITSGCNTPSPQTCVCSCNSKTACVCNRNTLHLHRSVRSVATVFVCFWCEIPNSNTSPIPLKVCVCVRFHHVCVCARPKQLVRATSATLLLHRSVCKVPPVAARRRASPSFLSVGLRPHSSATPLTQLLSPLSLS